MGTIIITGNKWNGGGGLPPQQKITPATEGNYLTTYQEGDDIKTYEGVKAMYTPADFDASTVREITPEEHLSYHAAKEQALQEEIERENNA